MINSILDTDLYKLTMQNAIMRQFPDAKVKYEFFNRGKTYFPKGFDNLLRQEIYKMQALKLEKEEKAFLKKNCYYLNDLYLDFLEGYRFKPQEIGVYQENGDLKITIEGNWYSCVLWEVPLMALISELYFSLTVGSFSFNAKTRYKNNISKASLFQKNNCKIADFGTRRRYSFDNQLEVVSDFQGYFDSENWFLGTSNPYIAMKLGLTPLGTYAHEWVSGVSALKGYIHGNLFSMEDWSEVYQGNLGIALPDTFGVDSFLKDFNTKYAKLFDGVRHDSGDPFLFTDKMIEHYKKSKIDPLTKTIVFSDSLNESLVLKLNEYCKGKIKCTFGIGTNLTNDVGVKPLNMVIKLTSINGVPAIKLSDTPEKAIGDPETIKAVTCLLNQKNNANEKL